MSLRVVRLFGSSTHSVDSFNKHGDRLEAEGSASLYEAGRELRVPDGTLEFLAFGEPMPGTVRMDLWQTTRFPRRYFAHVHPVAAVAAPPLSRDYVPEALARASAAQAPMPRADPASRLGLVPYLDPHPEWEPFTSVWVFAEAGRGRTPLMLLQSITPRASLLAVRSRTGAAWSATGAVPDEVGSRLSWALVGTLYAFRMMRCWVHRRRSTGLDEFWLQSAVDGADLLHTFAVFVDDVPGATPFEVFFAADGSGRSLISPRGAWAEREVEGGADVGGSCVGGAIGAGIYAVRLLFPSSFLSSSLFPSSFFLFIDVRSCAPVFSCVFLMFFCTFSWPGADESGRMGPRVSVLCVSLRPAGHADPRSLPRSHHRQGPTDRPRSAGRGERGFALGNRVRGRGGCRLERVARGGRRLRLCTGRGSGGLRWGREWGWRT